MDAYHPLVPALYQSESSIGQALGEFRRYAHFVEDCIDRFDDERSLEAKGLKIVYILDFQEIYNYLAPFLLHPTERRPLLDRFFSSKDLFTNPSEIFYLPMGTLAELSAFVQRLRNRITSLYQITLAENLDRAVNEFLSFFRAESFLKSVDVNSWLASSAESSPEARLIKIQSEALILLSDFEAGASRLYSILTSANLFDPSSLRPHKPLSLAEPSYRRILGELSGIRQRKGGPAEASDLRDIADAFNTSLAVTLNDQRDLPSKFSRARDGQSWMFFKIVTDTKSLFKLRNRLDAQLTYRNYHGYDVNLFERSDQVLYKRRLRHLMNVDRSAVRGLASLARKAKDALVLLDDLAINQNKTAEEVLSWVMRPEAARDLGLLSSIGNVIQDLRDFAREEQKVSQSISKAAREESASMPRMLNDSADRPYGARSVMSLGNTLDSIDRLIRGIEEIGVELRPAQRQRKYLPDQWNPLLSLKNLGFVESLIEVDSRYESLRATWTLKSKFIESPVLTLDIYQGFASLHWVTASAFQESVNVIRAFLVDRSVSEAKINYAMLVDHEGRELEAMDVASLEEVIENFPMKSLSFFRLDMPRLSFISEVFSRDLGYKLKTGVLFQLPVRRNDVEMFLNIFSQLSGHQVPVALLGGPVTQALEAYAFSPIH